MLLAAVHPGLVRSWQGRAACPNRSFFIFTSSHSLTIIHFLCYRARQAGWQCQILTDVFVVRSYSHFDAWTPGELLMGSPSSVSSTSLGTGGRRIPPPVAQRVPPGPGTPEPEARSSGRHAPANSLAQLQADPILASVVSSRHSLHVLRSFS